MAPRSRCTPLPCCGGAAPGSAHSRLLRDAWVVQHIRDPESAEQLVKACRPIFGRAPLFVSEVGPVLGAYAGPGMIGIGASVESAFE